MDQFIAWCGFLGAWLLVAGPLHQASRELDEEEIERDDMAAVAATVEQPPPVSKASATRPRPGSYDSR